MRSAVLTTCRVHIHESCVDFVIQGPTEYCFALCVVDPGFTGRSSEACTMTLPWIRYEFRVWCPTTRPSHVACVQGLNCHVQPERDRVCLRDVLGGPRSLDPQGPTGAVVVPTNVVSDVSKGGFALGDARSFCRLTSKIPPFTSMLKFDADVKKQPRVTNVKIAHRKSSLKRSLTGPTPCPGSALSVHRVYRRQGAGNLQFPPREFSPRLIGRFT